MLKKFRRTATLLVTTMLISIICSGLPVNADGVVFAFEDYFGTAIPLVNVATDGLPKSIGTNYITSNIRNGSAKMTAAVTAGELVVGGYGQHWFPAAVNVVAPRSALTAAQTIEFKAYATGAGFSFGGRFMVHNNENNYYEYRISSTTDAALPATNPSLYRGRPVFRKVVNGATVAGSEIWDLPSNGVSTPLTISSKMIFNMKINGSDISWSLANSIGTQISSGTYTDGAPFNLAGEASTFQFLAIGDFFAKFDDFKISNNTPFSFSDTFPNLFTQVTGGSQQITDYWKTSSVRFAASTGMKTAILAGGINVTGLGQTNAAAVNFVGAHSTLTSAQTIQFDASTATGFDFCYGIRFMVNNSEKDFYELVIDRGASTIYDRRPHFRKVTNNTLVAGSDVWDLPAVKTALVGVLSFSIVVNGPKISWTIRNPLGYVVASGKYTDPSPFNLSGEQSTVQLLVIGDNNATFDNFKLKSYEPFSLKDTFSTDIAEVTGGSKFIGTNWRVYDVWQYNGYANMKTAVTGGNLKITGWGGTSWPATVNLDFPVELGVNQAIQFDAKKSSGDSSFGLRFMVHNNSSTFANFYEVGIGRSDTTTPAKSIRPYFKKFKNNTLVAGTESWNLDPSGLKNELNTSVFNKFRIVIDGNKITWSIENDTNKYSGSFVDTDPFTLVNGNTTTALFVTGDSVVLFDNFGIKNLSTPVLTSVKSTDQASYTVNIANADSLGAEQSVKALSAFYKDNALVDCDVIPLSFRTMENGMVQFTVNNNQLAGRTGKLFIWDGVSNITPLLSATPLN